MSVLLNVLLLLVTGSGWMVVLMMAIRQECEMRRVRPGIITDRQPSVDEMVAECMRDYTDDELDICKTLCRDEMVAECMRDYDDEEMDAVETLCRTLCRDED